MARLELRPRSATEIVDAAFQLLRANYVPLVTLSVLAQLPLLAGRIYAAPYLANPSAISTVMTSGANLGAAVVVGIPLVLFLIVAQNAVLVAASQLYLGAPVNAGAALGRSLRRLISLILVYIVAFFFVLGGYILLIIPGIYILLRLIPLNSVAVLEDGGPIECIKRAWGLGRGRIGHMFVTWFLGFLIALGVGIIGTVLVAVLGTVIKVMADPNVNAIFSSAFAALIYPLTVVIMLVLYYDLRIRAEGFDVEMMSKDLGTPTPGH